MAEQPGSSTAEIEDGSRFSPGETKEDHRRQTQNGERETGLEVGRFIAAIPTVVDEAFDSPEWLFEIVEEGLPVLIIAGTEPEIRTRLGRNIYRYFPELSEAIRSLPPATGLDANVICRSRQDGAHERIWMTDHEIRIASERNPCLAVAHDVLAIAGEDYRAATAGRRDALAGLLSGVRESIELAIVAENNGVELVQLAVEANASGVLAKRKGTYYPGRLTRSWRFIPCNGRELLVVGGYQRDGENLSVLAGAFDGGVFEFIQEARVPVARRATVLRKLQPLTRRNHPFHENPGWKLGRFWTSPELVVEVERGRLVRIRPDLCPTDILVRRGGSENVMRMRRSRADSLRLQKRLRFPQP